jgi:Fe(3+) dicitrate transport protein
MQALRRSNVAELLGVLVIGIFLISPASGQTALEDDEIDEVIVVERAERGDETGRLSDFQNANIWLGKKNDVIMIGPQDLDANLAERVPRQIFAKVPGVFVYDMDGSGNQINISTRGLDPHRGWEFNIRRNGMITNSDMYGYPASHFSIPMEAIERVEIVRGTGSLQYGAQFGGLLNYVTKRPDPEKRFQFETINTVGSYGLLSTYNAISGRTGNTGYYVDFSKRVSDGYRASGETEFQTQSFMISHEVSDQVQVTAELARSEYLYQLPGPLTDEMFATDSREATRYRDYYSPDIYVPSVALDWQLNENTEIKWVMSAVLGERSSVMFVAPADVADEIDPITQQFAPRTVGIDNYNSYTSELKVLHFYEWLGEEHALAAGIQVMDNDLHRRQLGVGTTGSDFDLTLTTPGWGRDLHFRTDNVAAFVENSFAVSPKLSINPGFRIESGASKMSGSIIYLDPGDVPNTIDHDFTLFGVSAEYKLDDQSDIYAGWSQAYRPVIFMHIIPSSVLERADKNLKDARGHTIEAGFRGSRGGLRWDVGVFEIKYTNRMGTLAQFDENGQFFNLRTNIGDSVTRGVELFLQYRWQVFGDVEAEVFTSSAWMNGEYENAFVRVGAANISVDGNKVQSVPDLISRNGLKIRTPRASATITYSYTGDSFADPLNTVTPSGNGAVGLVPSYGLIDVSASVLLTEAIGLRLSANNVTDEQYFTKRPEFYPGPGVWPSDGRTYNLTVEFAIAR